MSPPVEHGYGPVQVEVGAQHVRVDGQPVAVGPRLGSDPLGKLLRDYGPHFQHPGYPRRNSSNAFRYAGL